MTSLYNIVLKLQHCKILKLFIRITGFNITESVYYLSFQVVRFVLAKIVNIKVYYQNDDLVFITIVTYKRQLLLMINIDMLRQTGEISKIKTIF